MACFLSLFVAANAFAGSKISFTSGGLNTTEIYVMNSDGTNKTRLTTNQNDDRMPAWSPDGSKIAFTSDRDGNMEIYVMNADGTNQINLTQNPAWDWMPAWSPDGSKIAFTSNRDGNMEIYVINADGTNQINLTKNPAANDEFPAWSPDGSKIAYVSNEKIYIMNADGTNPTRLTTNEESENSPAWSHDGSKLAFSIALSIDPQNARWEIYLINIDGSGQTNLTNNLMANDVWPAWSPDGSKIAFESDDGGSDFEIYVMNTDGTGLTNLTNNPTDDMFPAWGPEEISSTFYWKDYNGEADGGYMPDIDQKQDFPRAFKQLDFDYDDEGAETMPEWTSFAISAYSPTVGYGWDNVTGIEGRKRASGDALQKDFHFSSQDRTFIIDLPNGTYAVGLYMGDMQFPHDKMDVYAEGVLVENDISTAAGEVLFLRPSDVTVTDNQLNLLFHDDGGTDRNWVVNGIIIAPYLDNHYCAPVAEANSLWWLDKRWDHIEIFTDPINAGGYIGGDINHDGVADILDLVQDLARYMDTNGQRTGSLHTGTFLSDEGDGIYNFLHDYRLHDKLYATSFWFESCQWLFPFLADEVYACEDVKLDLGFYRVEECFGAAGNGEITWTQVGTHAVTVAGVDSQSMQLAISDPDNDAAEAGFPGVVRPEPQGHLPHPGYSDIESHNFEWNASHDIYTVVDLHAPFQMCVLQNYPGKINLPQGEWSGPFQTFWAPFFPDCVPGMIVTTVEAAVIVSPIICGNDVVDPGEECDDGNLSNGDGCSSTCQLEPDIAVSPTIWNFGNVVVGKSSTKTFTISNTDDNGTLTIGTITIIGTNANQFSKLNDNCSGQSITPSGSCTIDVKFSPTSLGAKSETLSIPSDDPDENPLDVPLNGTSVAPNVTCSFSPAATPPISIIRGGILKFHVTVQNNENTTQTFKFATKVKLPSGTMYPPFLIGPVNVTLNANSSVDGNSSLSIPLNATYGTYTYYGYVGIAGPPAVEYGRCQFDFTVVQ